MNYMPTQVYVKDPSILEEMKEKFQSLNILDSDNPLLYYIKLPNFLFLSNNYATFIGMNINYLTDRFIFDLANALVIIADSYVYVKKATKFVGEKLAKVFKSDVFKKLKEASIFYLIQNIFHVTSENLNYEIIISSTCNFVKNFKISSVSYIFTAIASLVSSHYYVFGFIGFSLALGWGFTKAKLDKERVENYSKVLEFIINKITCHPDEVLESNVFLASYDERNFYSILPSSYLRRNDGSVCEFQFIKDLKNAPKGKDIKGGEKIHLLADIFQKIFISKGRNIKTLRDKLKGMDFTQIPSNKYEYNEEEETDDE